MQWRRKPEIIKITTAIDVAFSKYNIITIAPVYNLLGELLCLNIQYTMAGSKDQSERYQFLLTSLN